MSDFQGLEYLLEILKNREKQEPMVVQKTVFTNGGLNEEKEKEILNIIVTKSGQKSVKFGRVSRADTKVAETQMCKRAVIHK